MTLNLALRLGGVTSSDFDPLSIAWHSAYWASDPSWSNPGNGNNVTSWRDGSGNGRNVTTGSGTAPVYRSSVASFNNRPAVQFNAGDLRYTFSANVSQPVTKVIVARPAAVPVTQHIFSSTAATKRGSDLSIDSFAGGNKYSMFGGSAQLQPGTPDVATHLWFAYFDGASSTFTLDGTVIGSGTNVGTQQTDSHDLGAFNSSPASNGFAGHIAFAGFIARALTTQEKSDLLAWSRSFYGTP